MTRYSVFGGGHANSSNHNRNHNKRTLHRGAGHSGHAGRTRRRVMILPLIEIVKRADQEKPKMFRRRPTLMSGMHAGSVADRPNRQRAGAGILASTMTDEALHAAVVVFSCILTRE